MKMSRVLKMVHLPKLLCLHFTKPTQVIMPLADHMFNHKYYVIQTWGANRNKGNSMCGLAIVAREINVNVEDNTEHNRK